MIGAGLLFALAVGLVLFGLLTGRHYLEIAIRHCRRLKTLVSELLGLARQESARMDLSPEPFDPRELIREICQ